MQVKDIVIPNIFIIAESIEVAQEIAVANDVAYFKWVEDYTNLAGSWGVLDGFNKDNSVFWFASRYFMHPSYLYVSHISHTFGIPAMIIEGYGIEDCSYIHNTSRTLH